MSDELQQELPVDPVAEEAPKKTRKPREKKPPKPKKVKPARDLRSVFRAKLKEISVESIKKPWMAEKAFRLIDTAPALEAWVDSILADTSRHHAWVGTTCPVVAVDTETTSLDTRILIDIQQREDGSWELTYEVKVELAGVCLSADGIEGIYVPVFHEKGNNIPREAAAHILQRLFDRAHLVFYNAKFDREILRLTLGLDLRPYPHFEDVQVLKYINDPKADLGDKGQYGGDAGGLKALSKNVLGIEQIELSELAKVRAHKWDEEKQKNTLKDQHVPFTWVPTHLALWYAAGDAICTWLLWERMKYLARSRKLVHHIDHELVDSLTFVERQRFYIDVPRLRRTSRWHHKKTEGLFKQLQEMAIAAGWKGAEEFNPGSPVQLGKLLFNIMGFKAYRTTDNGNISTDKETITELLKSYPDNEFLLTFKKFKEYAALHPENLKFDPQDNTARMYLKQNVVGGGRLSGAGGEFDRDGGFELNPQGVKKLEPDQQWRVYGNVLDPDDIPADQIEPHDEKELHPSCFHMEDEETITGYTEPTVTHSQDEWGEELEVTIPAQPIKETRKLKKQAPGIVHNHIGQYQGYAICLVPGCPTCREKFGILIPNTSMDANETVNLRCLFIAQPAWTFFSIDYCLSPEMRVLTSDLRWKQAKDVIKGEELIGFDEDLPNSRWGRRRLKGSCVEQIKKLKLPCVRITTDKGAFVVSKDHGWLVERSTGGRKGTRGKYGWVASGSLLPGDRIARLCDPWDEETGRNASFKFLGSIRPERLIVNARKKLWEGKTCSSRYTAPDRVLSVEDVGIQEVVAIRTTTHTFVAEGLLSHNCNIEVRCAANLSGEPELQKIFLEGDGDHHALTASKVFPGYSNPDSQDYKAKSLRSLAKIINFALQYGGTEYTIYESMSKKDPTITRERAKQMVDDYWKGVPKFAEWCSMKRHRARTELVCETATGRVIGFQSAMDAKRIHKPSDIERKNLGKYYDLRKVAKAAEAEDDADRGKQYKDAAERMWKNPDTGVRNAIEYNKFLGKIERVSVNAPVQGIAGDFMRIALNRIRLWVQKDPGIQQVFRLHGSVHDEIDISIKNEYAPFVLPRLTRLMKLRKYHRTMKWPVPIECDAEYGRSWDIDFNVTDKKHPDAYTHIRGIEKYIPHDFNVTTLTNLKKFLLSGEEQKLAKVKAWMHANLHPRAFEATTALFKVKEPKEIHQLLTAVCQLHEYWTIDHTPDEEEDKLETLAAYEQRMGLTEKNRGIAPEFGYLGAIPLNARVKRPEVPVLGDEPMPDQGELQLSVGGDGEVSAAPTLEPPEPEPEPSVTPEIIEDYEDTPQEKPLPKAGKRIPFYSVPVPPEQPHKDNKPALVVWGQGVEKVFVKQLAPLAGIMAKINPEKSFNCAAIDLIVDPDALADLKYQGKPFFSCYLRYRQFNLDPQTTVSYNRGDTKYPDGAWVYFWVNWEILKGSDVPGYSTGAWRKISMKPMGGIWRIKADDIRRIIDAGKAPIHEYNRELDSHGMANESHSYLLDLRHPYFEQMAWFDYEAEKPQAETVPVYVIKPELQTDEDAAERLAEAVGVKGSGLNTIWIKLEGKIRPARDRRASSIPDEFVESVIFIDAADLPQQNLTNATRA